MLGMEMIALMFSRQNNKPMYIYMYIRTHNVLWNFWSCDVSLYNSENLNVRLVFQ